MGWATWAAIYFTVWWTVLFLVLPFGRKQEGDANEVGHQPGAPARPMIVKKFIWTTIISAIILTIVWSSGHFGLVDWKALLRGDPGP
jgi:predicted secreted protein